VIALDTNVLVRFLVEDDARQTEQAAALIERAVASGDTLFVSDVVIAEMVWVLSVSYRISRPQIAATLRDLLRARHLTFAASDQLTRAVDLFARGKGDFADYLIGVHARVAGCETVATFDRVLLRESGFMTPMQAR
jgi:predicted nucleic-acid-binding protein